MGIKIKRFIRGILIIFVIMSFFVLLGLAGESDINGMETNQLIYRGGVTLIFLITCFVGQALLKEDGND